MGKIKGDKVRASWFNPRNGNWEQIGVFENSGNREFQTRSEIRNGNDRVLVLDSFK